MRHTGSAMILLVAVAAGACGGSSAKNASPAADQSGGSTSAPGGGQASGAPRSGGAGGAGGSAASVPAPALPPEMEEVREFESPRAGARFVYVANPKRDTVAVIDSTTLAIQSVSAGDTPTYLTTLPGQDVAVVLNVGSNDATILRTDGLGVTRATTVPTVKGVNALAVSPDGKHVIAWPSTASRGSAGNFNAISAITLGATDASIPMTVGFRPSEIEFTSDGSTAFVITEDGVSIVRFADVTAPAVAPFVSLGDPAGAASRDVSVTPDGKYALARREGASQIQLTDLATRASKTVDLKSPVTDLDLSPDAQFALAVLRDTGTVVRLSLPGGFTDDAQRRAIKIDGETVGSASITPDGKTAVLYTTAAKIERVVILPLDGAGAPLPVRLKKAVRAVALAPDGHTALVVHTKDAGNPKDPNIDVEVMIDRSYGYSVVDLRSGFAKLQLTDAPVGELAITPDGARGFVLLRDDMQSIRIAQRVDFASFLVTDYPLGSPPVSIATLGGTTRVFVSQEHPEGRISFIDWMRGVVESVTGFELNGRIVQ